MKRNEREEKKKRKIRTALESKPLGILLTAFGQSILSYGQHDESIGVRLRFLYMNEQYWRIDLTISMTEIVFPI